MSYHTNFVQCNGYISKVLLYCLKAVFQQVLTTVLESLGFELKVLKLFLLELGCQLTTRYFHVVLHLKFLDSM